MGNTHRLKSLPSRSELWARYQQHLCHCPELGLKMDVSRMMFDESLQESLAPAMAAALQAMTRLEAGAIANADEDRMVGHYWLRDPALAPDPEITAELQRAIADVKQFADDVHAGAVAPEKGEGFFIVLVIGIGGSSLGARFLCDALGASDAPMIVRFLDNTDPDGIDRMIAELDDSLTETLTLVVSKSGGTKETRNAMLEVENAYKQRGLSFARHAVAITCDDSELCQRATDAGWLRVFPMWDWVGGRTSVLSPAGLLPAALQGIDIDALLSGARACDGSTRSTDPSKNPAALLAYMWHYAGNGRGDRAMVVLPYRDRLVLLGQYLQQLVMESLGKGRYRSGESTTQGLTVYGNKGSTDQHAFVQQLRDGRDDFFALFVTICDDRSQHGDAPKTSLEVEESRTSGDFLSAFWQGTREALFANGRESTTITLDELTPRAVGTLIALFERTVGLYAELIDVNAYDQPGVEAGKTAATKVLELQQRALAHLSANADASLTAEELAIAIGEPDCAETVFHVLCHAAANADHAVRYIKGASPSDGRFASL